MKSKIRELLEATGVSAAFLRTAPGNTDSAFFYFSRLQFGLLDNNLLLLRKDKKPLLFRTVLDPEIKSKAVRVKTVKKRKEMIAMLKKELKGKKVGINKSLYPIASFNALRRELPKKRFVDISQPLAESMSIKEQWEIARIAKAVSITEKVLRQLPSVFRRGMTEKQLALKIEFLLREKSGDELAFPIVVASGRNSAFPHHVPTDKKIRKGILLIDCGARYKGYCADLTRVFSVGKPSKREKRIYGIVLEAKGLAEGLVLQGAAASVIFEKVSSFLRKSAGQGLIHGLGHGLGLKPHDSPSGFLPESRDILAKNMVLTVEPGVYFKGFGIRIEDDIVVGKGKCRKLSNAPKELISL